MAAAPTRRRHAPSLGTAAAAARPPGTWGWRLAALGAGAPLALAFPRPALWWVAFVGLVPLLALAAAAPTLPEAALRTWLGGTGFFLAVDAFLWPQVGPFMVPLALLLGLVWLPLGALAWRLLRPGGAGRLAAALVLLPSAVVAGEYVRSWQGLGGPWGLLGASQWNDRPVLAVAALGGVWAVSFLLVTVNVAVAAALLPGGRGRRLAAAACAAALLGGALAWAALRPDPVGGTARVALVQPGVVHAVEPRLRASEAATRALRGGPPPDLVVWAESSIGRDAAASPADLARLEADARAAGAPLLVGLDARRGGAGIYKTALLVGPAGPLGHYDKMRLVPFGEYVPLRPLLGWVTRVTAAATVDRRRGHHLEVLAAGRLRVGPLICFESAFPDLSRHLAVDGADLVVVQTADTTFQRSWGPDQHASLAAVRAVESGRPVVQAALSGVSAAFDADGRRLAWQPGTWRGATVVAVPLAAGDTPYVRLGDWVPAACGLALAVAAAGALSRRRRA